MFYSNCIVRVRFEGSLDLHQVLMFRQNFALSCKQPICVFTDKPHPHWWGRITGVQYDPLCLQRSLYSLVAVGKVIAFNLFVLQKNCVKWSTSCTCSVCCPLSGSRPWSGCAHGSFLWPARLLPVPSFAEEKQALVMESGLWTYPETFYALSPAVQPGFCCMQQEECSKVWPQQCGFP